MSRHLLSLFSLSLVLLIAGMALAAHPAAAAQSAPDPSIIAADQPQTFDCLSVTEIPTSECEALVALYNSTDGANWYVNTGWLQSTTPCSWQGVACTEGHVSQLVLQSNHLAGTLPSELGNLMASQKLDLSHNLLYGTIPSSLGRLTALQTLDLGSNGLSGEISPELGNLTVLRVLELNDNQLSGTIPPQLGNLATVWMLVLSNNQLSGAIPRELGNLATLQYLGLGNNQLSGSIPPELGNLAALRHLGLSENQLSGPIPQELGNLTALENLYLNNNQLSGPIPPELGNLTNIRARWTADQDPWSIDQPIDVLKPAPPSGYLNLSSNRLGGTIPIELSKLSAAAGINLSYNQLDGMLPPEVGSAMLRMYDASPDYNKLSGYDAALYPGWYWYTTQTVPPTDLQAIAQGAAVQLIWTPIAYAGDGGYYEVSYATSSAGPFAFLGHTVDKTVGHYTVTGLTPNIIYYFRIRTFTPAHSIQQNYLWSDYSAVVSAGGETPTPTPTATDTPSVTPSATATATVTSTATPTATSTPTVTATATPVRCWLPLIWR